MARDMVTSMKRFVRKKCKKLQNFKFFEKSIFMFLIISLATFDLQEPNIPQIKAENISFGPYVLNFLAKINIL